MRPKTPTTIFLEALALKCGLSVKHLRSLKLAGLPTSTIEAALRWLSQRPDAAPATTSSVEALRLARLRLVTAQSEKAELALAVERGELVSRVEVRQMFCMAGHAIRSSLLKVEGDLVSKIHGKPLEDARRIARDELRLVMLDLQNSESEYWQNHPLSD